MDSYVGTVGFARLPPPPRFSKSLFAQVITLQAEIYTWYVCSAVSRFSRLSRGYHQSVPTRNGSEMREVTATLGWPVLRGCPTAHLYSSQYDTPNRAEGGLRKDLLSKSFPIIDAALGIYLHSPRSREKTRSELCSRRCAILRGVRYGGVT